MFFSPFVRWIFFLKYCNTRSAVAVAKKSVKKKSKSQSSKLKMLCCCNLEHHATPWLPNSSQTELIYAADCIISFLMEMDLRNRLPSLLSYVHGPVPLTDDQRTRCFLTR